MLRGSHSDYTVYSTRLVLEQDADATTVETTYYSGVPIIPDLQFSTPLNLSDAAAVTRFTGRLASDIALDLRPSCPVGVLGLRHSSSGKLLVTLGVFPMNASTVPMAHAFTGRTGCQLSSYNLLNEAFREYTQEDTRNDSVIQTESPDGVEIGWRMAVIRNLTNDNDDIADIGRKTFIDINVLKSTRGVVDAIGMTPNGIYDYRAAPERVNEDDAGGLSDEEIMFIGIGCGAFALLVGVGVGLWCYFKKRGPRPNGRRQMAVDGDGAKSMSSAEDGRSERVQMHML